MKNKDRNKLVKEAFESILLACKMFDLEMTKLPENVQGLLLDCYKLGFMKGLEEMRGSEKK